MNHSNADTTGTSYLDYEKLSSDSNVVVEIYRRYRYGARHHHWSLRRKVIASLSIMMGALWLVAPSS